MGTPKGFAIFLIVLGWLALIFMLAFVAVALAHAYPAWSILIYIVEYAIVLGISWNIPRAWRTVTG